MGGHQNSKATRYQWKGIKTPKPAVPICLAIDYLVIPGGSGPLFYVHSGLTKDAHTFRVSQSMG